MQKHRFAFGLLTVILGLCGGAALAQLARPGAKLPARQIEREVDPDAGGEAPYNPTGDAGEVAAGTNCETIGGFSSTFQFSNRFRGNLYRIVENGVFVREIKMQLAFAGTANLFVSAHKKQADGSYVEVDLNGNSPTQGYIFLGNAQGLGTNTAAFYTTGPINNGLGAELTPGDYAIGFAWASETIKFGRDSSIYPKPINEGSTLASISRDVFPPIEPPLPATLPSLTQFTGGAYSMELCFVPVAGACCLSEGVESHCENLLEGDCVGEGSFFHGQRTTCKDTICEFGACCFECDTPVNGFVAKCRDNYVTESCAAAGGINFWSEVGCPADDSSLCPKLVGACCNGTSCSLKCETECLAAGGTYQGDGTNCDPNTHKCKGACCVTGGCLDRTQAGCAASNGDFHGSGTRCFSESCGGACCYGFTSDYEFCDDFDDRNLCTYDPQGFPNIAYRGDGTQCPNNCKPAITEPQYQACCLPDGSCMNTFSTVCNASWIQGTLIPNQLCKDIPANTCPNMVARCCFNDGSCELLIGNACTARGGTSVVGQTTCPFGACNSQAGACCGTSTGACTMKTASQCNADGGFYRGDTSDCSNAAGTCPGFGACCRGNGDCLENQTQAQCTTLEGAFGGAGSTCAAQHCDQRGACCAVTGSCLNTTAGTCAGIEGGFKGVGVQCAPGVCPSGACCEPEGCKKRSPAGCVSDAGDYKGDGTSCGLDTCVVQGGCCRAGACTVETPDECADGNYLGNGTNCDGTPCALGACCRLDGACEENAEQGSCLGPGESFTAAAACSGVTCTPKGACCVVGADCAVTTQAACTGQYMGDGQACGFGVCPATGACCNGTICTVNTQAGCASGGGAYKGDNTLCSANTCPATPTGACCNATACTITTQADCSSGSGSYKGDNVPCAVDTCSSGTSCSALSSTDPVTCWVDARRPHAPGHPETLQGRDSLTMTFGSACTAAAADFAVICSPTAAPCPTVSNVSAVGATQTITLSSVIPAGNWTCVKHTATNAQVCLGSLPGDVDGNRTTAPVDILRLIDNLNGIGTALALDHCDLDRSNLCVPADILALIDLLNGTNGFIVWNGKNLPVCPSP